MSVKGGEKKKELHGIAWGRRHWGQRRATQSIELVATRITVDKLTSKMSLSDVSFPQEYKHKL